MRNEQKTLLFTLTGGVWQAGANVNAKLTAVAGGWQYLNGQDGLENYDSNGRLLSITNRAGRRRPSIIRVREILPRSATHLVAQSHSATTVIIASLAHPTHPATSIPIPMMATTI